MQSENAYPIDYSPSPTDQQVDPHQPALPNLFIIGASKSGSSALHAYLAGHPEIAMSTEKEPCFFVDQEELQAAWPVMARQPCSHERDAYLALWDHKKGATFRGEGSVYYSQAPHRSGVAARIAAATPNARIIYIVREPVSRAVAHYWQRFKEFQEPLPLDRAVQENPIYRDTSDYALQLQAYLQYFDKSQIHIIVAEDLRTNRREVLARCIEWLGLPPFEYDDAHLADRHVSPPTSRRAKYPIVAAVRNSRLWALARKHLSADAISKLRSAATTSFEKKQIDETGARNYLQDYLKPRRADFEQLIGRRITAWDTP